MNERITSIEISKEYLHFAAAHFTIFSATERENLHGHNFHVTLRADALIHEDGLTFDYNILKNAVKAMCDSLDEQVLMPQLSPHLEVAEHDDHVAVIFNGEQLSFLRRDITLLPVRNITVEELSAYLLTVLRERPDIAILDIHKLILKCSSGEGQWATAEWDHAAA
ncbi:MAG: 6-carboxytetrahydropterin synthase [Pseudomonadota bacterium]